MARLMRICAAALGALALAAACTPGGDAPAERAAPPGPPRTLVYLDRTTLTVHDLATGDTSEGAVLPSADVAVAPAGDRYAVVAEEDPAGDPEGFVAPVLHLGDLGDLGGDPDHRLGSGRAPMFTPGGALAALVPVPGEQVCGVAADGHGHNGDDCVTAERAVLYENFDIDPAPLTGAGAWSLLATSGDRDVLIGSLTTGAVTLAAPLDTKALPVTVPQVWGLSPRDETLLIVDDDGARIAGPRRDEDVALGPRARLGDGTWSPDGTTIAAVVVRRGGSHLALVDAATGAVQRVRDSAGAQGQVVWGADGATFAYVRTQRGRPARLQAVLCESARRCRALFDRREGIALLALI